MNEEIVGVICIFILLVLTCLNIVFSNFDSWEMWFVHALLLIFIPAIYLSMFSLLYFDFAELLMYLLLSVNIYVNYTKLGYLYSERDRRNQEW